MNDPSDMTKAELLQEIETLRAETSQRDQCGEQLVRFRSLVNDLPQLIFEINAGGRFTFFNDYALHALGLTADDVAKGVSLTDVVHPDSMDLARVNIARTLSGKRNSGVEYSVMRKNGEHFPVKVFTIGIREGDVVKAVRGVAMDMTEIRETELALRKSEERYQLVVRGANDGIWDWDLTTDQVYFSPRYREILGYSLEEFPDEINSWKEAVHPEDLQRVMEANGECINGEVDKFEVEYRMRRKGGSYVWIHGRGANMKNEVGAVYRLSGTHTDITRRKRTERALMESERRFRNLFLNASDGVYQCNPEGEFLSANPVMARILGYDSPSDLVKSVESIGAQCYVNPEDRKLFMAALQRDGSLNQYELNLKRRDGSHIWVSESVRASYDENGELEYYEGFLQDITLRKQTELTNNALYAISKAISASSDLDALYATIHEIIDEMVGAPNFFIGLYDKDEDAVTIAYFADEKDEATDSCNVSDPRNGSLTARVIRSGASLLSTRDDIQTQEATEPGCEQPACWLGTPLKIQGAIVGIMAVQSHDDPKRFSQNDVAFMEAVSEQAALAVERKINEEALRQLNEELEDKVEQRTKELQRKAAELETANRRLTELDEIKSTLVSSISHELRTPLTSIRGFAKLASRDFTKRFSSLSDDPTLIKHSNRIRQNMEIIETEGQRLTRLINDFLDINRIESGKATWNDQFINPCDVLRQAANAVSGAFASKDGVELVVEMPEAVPPIHADPDKIMQALINLLDNACKFTAQGEVRVSLETAKDVVTVTVADTGVGIPPDEIERIFDKFHKLYPKDDEAAKGTGLGLAICREIVQRYGGEIWAESDPGEGSAFIFTLPAEAGAYTACV